MLVMKLVITTSNLNLLKVLKPPLQIASMILRLIDHDLTGTSPPEMEGDDYGYAIFEPMQDLNISNKSTPLFSLTIISLERNKHDNAMMGQNRMLKFTCHSVQKS